MKRAAVVIAVLGMCLAVCGQDNNKPTGAAGPASATQGKRPPQAKTKPEYDAFNAAMALSDPAAVEKAADDFATKFPSSELRMMLYKSAMEKYLQANNADKMLDMARKALALDPDDPESLVETARVLAQRTRDTDLDKDERRAEAKKDAERALVTVDTDVPTTGVPQERLDQFKGYVRSEAYASLGTLASKANNWPEAESYLRKSIEAFPQEMDSVAVLMLAIALDKQDKYPEALKYANQAVDLTKDRPDSEAGKAAREEQDRLTQLNKGSAPGQAAPKK
jgi:tetratricopeptide (TPR) repeat protein